jgi:hypothetical protein
MDDKYTLNWIGDNGIIDGQPGNFDSSPSPLAAPLTAIFYKKYFPDVQPRRLRGGRAEGHDTRILAFSLQVFRRIYGLRREDFSPFDSPEFIHEVLVGRDQSDTDVCVLHG